METIMPQAQTLGVSPEYVMLAAGLGLSAG
jgi:hypothetical protein